MSRDQSQPHRLAGVYELERYEIQEAAGEKPRQLKGARGLLIYTADGHVSVSISAPEGANPAASSSTIAYAGRYRILSDSTLEHTVEVSSPNRLEGSRLSRIWRLEGNILELVGLGLAGGDHRLVWRRRC